MPQYTPFLETAEQLYSFGFKPLMVKIYEAIPSHNIESLSSKERDDLLGYYPHLYMQLSELFTYLLVDPSVSRESAVKIARKGVEQALKVVKFQYEGLSRKLSFQKEEKHMWTHS